MRLVHLPALFALVLLAPTAAHAQAASPPRSRALALTLEILNPLGGSGCFYQRQTVAGVLVTAGSLIAGSLLVYAAHVGDRDATIVGAVAYGAMRGIGVAAAAQTYAPPGVPPATAALPLGLSYRFSF